MPVIMLLCHLNCYYKLHKKTLFMHVHAISFSRIIASLYGENCSSACPYPYYKVDCQRACNSITVAVTCVMFLRDVKIFLQVIKFSLSQKYAD